MIRRFSKWQAVCRRSHRWVHCHACLQGVRSGSVVDFAPLDLLTHVAEVHSTEARLLLPGTAIARCLHDARCRGDMSQLVVVLCLRNSIASDRLAAMSAARDDTTMTLLFAKGDAVEYLQARLSRSVQTPLAVLPPDGPAEEESMLHATVALCARLSQMGHSRCSAAGDTTAPLSVCGLSTGDGVLRRVVNTVATGQHATPLAPLPVTVVTTSPLVKASLSDLHPRQGGPGGGLEIEVALVEVDED